MQNVVTFKQPKFKPMPSELTPAVINGATLPVKVEAAKRAIAACCDLSELLTWKNKLAALAAAAKIARMPEMARDVNRVHKEAIFRMGEILLQYNGTARPQCGNSPPKLSLAQIADAKKMLDKGMSQVAVAKYFKVNPPIIWKVANEPSYGASIGDGSGKSERAIAAEAVGISKTTAGTATRLAAAPPSVRDAILENPRIPPNACRMAASAPRRGTQGAKSSFSDAAMIFFSGITREQSAFISRSGKGLTGSASALRTTDLSTISQLTPEEKQRARKLVVEMQEILDDIDRRLGPA
jgi:hypothetical protein